MITFPDTTRILPNIAVIALKEKDKYVYSHTAANTYMNMCIYV